MKAHSQTSGLAVARRQPEPVEAELRVASRLEAVGQLAAGVAHEINTPIQYVGDSLQFLRDGFGDLAVLLGTVQAVVVRLREQGDEATAAILGEAWKAADADFLTEHVPKALDRTFDGIDRVATIVGAMKAFAHPGNEDRAEANVNQAIQNTLIVSRNEYKYVADVVTDLGELPLLRCNIGELNQVFLNLIVNAAHAVGEGVAGTDRRGTIRVRTRSTGGSLIVEIEDDGAGIPDEIAARIFDPFFTTKPVGKGTGQGLTIARTIVARHKGTLEVRSSRGVGTTFVITLPEDAADDTCRP